ncbi:Predicted arabinose efflux permease, MFS family [Micromonospora pattaloongensis]|uniref:Predicted arabinose efflux permease, MFS family n=1 Tax=Micromonospora pattaloongensis TaxID=405436 RepID=A0A1H3SLT6_9ACTN|nr:MFS transporter [Micromonospora pattaloongensis]SDZ38638.1 Predicted arabinose efflux permease, MFS family [Micromonospora pattaloongensis]
MVHMPLLPSLGRVVGTAVRGLRLLGRGAVGSGRWTTRRVGRLRERGAGGERGMLRLFDLHAASCAGDTLIAIGLAGTIFFDVPLGEARSKVGLYLLVTMVPFALLAPVVGPLLDHFRHGRRYALAATMLGRAFLAWLLSDHIHGFGLYPAAFGVLALSRAYGVGRSAAVPRLLPEGLGLSQAGARASVYGTIAGALVVPLGLAAFLLGPQWPLRIASLIFLVGMVIALRLPPRADSDPPETMPRALALLAIRREKRPRVLSGRLVTAALLGSAALRGLYGFLLLFLAFAVKSRDLTTELLGRDLGDERALGLIGAAFAVGTFLATAAGTRLRIHQPVALQATGLVAVAVAATFTTLRFSLPTVALLCLVTAIVSGMAKLAVDAVIQERVHERLRASAFAHSETLLMLAFVAGGALGLIPVGGRIGVGAAAAGVVLAALWAVVAAARLRRERLHGRAASDADPTSTAAPHTPTAPVTPTAASTTTAAPTPTAGPPAAASGPDAPPADPTPTLEDVPLAPPGYHIYRPSSAVRGPGVGGDEGSRRESPEARG